jgi:hypothetical protein
MLNMFIKRSTRLLKLSFEGLDSTLTSDGSWEWVGKEFHVLLLLGSHILASEDDLNSTLEEKINIKYSTINAASNLGSHDGDFSGGPGVVDVTPQMLGAHDVISTTVCLTCNHGDLGDRGFSVGIQQLCSVSDDSVVLL